MFVTVRQPIPEGLADIAPGLELAGVLAGIELSQLSGYDSVEVLKARRFMQNPNYFQSGVSRDDCPESSRHAA